MIGAACGLPVRLDRRLVDRAYRSWAGRPQEELVAAFGSVDAAPDVEPATAVRERAMAALCDLVRGLGGAAAVVVTHDAVFRLSLAACDPRLGDHSHLQQQTGRFSTLEFRSGRWRVLSINQDPQRSR